MLFPEKSRMNGMKIQYSTEPEDLAAEMIADDMRKPADNANASIKEIETVAEYCMLFFIKPILTRLT